MGQVESGGVVAMLTIAWIVGIILGIFILIFLACFVQAALEKMNLIPGVYNNVGWSIRQPGERDIGLLSLIPQLREYPPGYPVPPPGQPIYWHLFPNNAQGSFPLTVSSGVASGDTGPTAPTVQSQVQQSSNVQVSQVQTGVRPTTMYHGTPEREWGLSILQYNVWRAGAFMAVYISPEFKLAVAFARSCYKQGVVVELYVSPDVRLLQNGPNIFYASVPGTFRENQYYRLKGIRPVRLLDINGKQIKP